MLLKIANEINDFEDMVKERTMNEAIKQEDIVRGKPAVGGAIGASLGAGLTPILVGARSAPAVGLSMLGGAISGGTLGYSGTNYLGNEGLIGRQDMIERENAILEEGGQLSPDAAERARRMMTLDADKQVALNGALGGIFGSLIPKKGAGVLPRVKAGLLGTAIGGAIGYQPHYDAIRAQQNKDDRIRQELIDESLAERARIDLEEGE